MATSIKDIKDSKMDGKCLLAGLVVYIIASLIARRVTQGIRPHNESEADE